MPMPCGSVRFAWLFSAIFEHPKCYTVSAMVDERRRRLFDNVETEHEATRKRRHHRAEATARAQGPADQSQRAGEAATSGNDGRTTAHHRAARAGLREACPPAQQSVEPGPAGEAVRSNGWRGPLGPLFLFIDLEVVAVGARLRQHRAAHLLGEFAERNRLTFREGHAVPLGFLVGPEPRNRGVGLLAFVVVLFVVLIHVLVLWHVVLVRGRAVAHRAVSALLRHACLRRMRGSAAPPHRAYGTMYWMMMSASPTVEVPASLLASERSLALGAAGANAKSSSGWKPATPSASALAKQLEVPDTPMSSVGVALLKAVLIITPPPVTSAFAGRTALCTTSTPLACAAVMLTRSVPRPP